ncbi:hypothetical protein [Thermoactinospora rubra]|uniref:hypothetical protein n=1 Tax=Thermoactinospora rubra TaxID=1088767 RepID=UPI000A11308D|nr:hypothetical protein [Thermoactinospora rubra]
MRAAKAGRTVAPGKPPGVTRRRRRAPKSDWQFPLLTDWGLRPEQQRLLVIIASVVGVLAAAATGVALIASLGGARPEPATLSAQAAPSQDWPSDFQGWTSPKEFAPIAERGKDSRPLTAGELFGAKTLTVDKKVTLKLAGKAVEADCAAALWGRHLVEEVAKAGCTQVARGLYVSASRRYVAQYTLLNLRDVRAADGLVTALKTLYRDGWVRPLPAGEAAMPQRGYTQASAYAMGHYVGLVWVARADGAEPGPKDDFVSLALALRTLEKPLYRRVVAVAGPTG